MTESWVIISDMALSALRALFCILFLCRARTLGTQERGKKKKEECRGGTFGKAAALVLAGAAALSVIFYFLDAPELYAACGEALLTAACAARFCGTGMRSSLFFSIFYEFGLALWGFLAGALAAVLSGDPAFLCQEGGRGQLALWAFYLIFAALSVWLLRKKELTEKGALKLASRPVILGFLAVITLSEQKRIAISEDTLYLWILLSLVLLAGILVFSLRRQYEMEEELLRLQSERSVILEREYRALNRSYSVNARLFHDFHNHMGALRELLVHRKYGEALAYLEELEGPVRELTAGWHTGDETLDFLIGSKAASAAERQIRFQAEAEIPRHTNLTSADLTAIVGNFLDNALEAAERVQDPERRFVSLVIRRINQMLVIKVENSYGQEPEERGNEGEAASAGRLLKTTKADGGLHGWGLKSAEAAAEKYEGVVRTSWEGGVFRAAAVLSFRGQKTAD